jgi:hypothetical protein
VASYEVTLSAVLKGVIHDLSAGTDTAAVLLRDLADAQMKLDGVKEFGTDQALKAFPGIWLSICRASADKLSKVMLPAED